MTTPTITRLERSSSKRDAIQASISVGDVSVEGDMQGHIVFGNNNVVGDNNVILEVNNSQGAVVELHTPPTIKRRDSLSPPPRPPKGFVGREKELELLAQHINTREATLVYAHDGIGKTFLIKMAANSDAAQTMPDGIITIEAQDESKTVGLDDIFQQLFDTLYESSPPVKVTRSVARGYLNNTQPLIILDNLELSTDILNRLPDMLPKAALIAANQHQIFDDIFETIPLHPLERDKSMALFGEKSGVPQNNDTQQKIDSICHLLNDVPLAIEKVAKAVREKRLRFEALADRLATIQSPSQNKIQAAIDRSFGLIYSELDHDERDMLAFVAAAPGNSVDRSWLESISGGERTSQSLESLELLYANSPRLRLPDGLRETLQTGVSDLPDRREYLLEYLLGELESRFRDFEFVSDELGNILGLLHWTIDQGRWLEAVTLGKAVDPYLTLHGLWDAWGTVLNQVMEASQHLQDLVLRGWVLHQLGTREIGVGSLQQAVNLLMRALEIRASLGDRVSVAYTLHNLNIILPPTGGGQSERPKEPPDDPSIPERLRELFTSIQKAYSRRFGDKPFIFTAPLLIGGILLVTLVAFFGIRPSLALQKEADTTRFNLSGQVIDLNYMIDNTGFMRLRGPISISDDGAVVSCEDVETVGNQDAYLDWNEYVRCSGQYTITETDIENGTVIHSSQAIAPQQELHSAEETVILNFDSRFLILSVKPGVEGYRRTGEKVRYFFIIENTGQETLDGPFEVFDDKMEVSCPDVTAVGNRNAVLDPKEILICNATYTITEEDIEYGSVTSTSTARADEIDAKPVRVTLHRLSTLLPTSSLELQKSADRETYQELGEQVRYEYVVTNSGDERLIGPVIVRDDGVEVVCEEVQNAGNQDEWLDPGESLTCNATYTITEFDIEITSVTNIAQASADGVESERKTTTIYFENIPQTLMLVKAADRETYSEVGEEIRFSYLISNGGSLPVPGPITVSDDRLEVDCPELDTVGNQDEALDPGEDLICTAIFIIQEEFFRFASITNTAWARAGEAVSALQSFIIVNGRLPDGNPSPSILKLSKFAEPNTYTTAGEIIRYQYFVTNEGRGSTKGPVLIEDDMVQEITCPDLEAIGDGDTVLDPDETVICTGQYEISDEDIDLGQVTNTALARTEEVSSNPSTITIHEKTLILSISANLEAYKQVDDHINYSYTITSRSKAPVSIPLTVMDDKFEVTCPDYSTVGNEDDLLDWNETITCSATHVVTQADIDPNNPDADRGFITNQAVAHSGEIKSNLQSHTIPGPDMDPKLSLASTAEPSDYDSVDQVITYTHVIKNTGNITLPPELKVTDDGNADLPLDCNPEKRTLAPQETVTCKNTYTVSQEDFNYGNSSVTKNYSAAGIYRGETITSPPVSVTILCTYPPKDWTSFIVSPGESMQQVLMWYPGTSLLDIQKANCMGATPETSTGQTLYVPAPPPQASVSGTIRDTAGRPLNRIPVVLTDSNGGQTVRLTNGNGWYLFDGLGPGSYRIFDQWFTLSRGNSATQNFVIVPTAP